METFSLLGVPCGEIFLMNRVGQGQWRQCHTTTYFMYIISRRNGRFLRRGDVLLVPEGHPPASQPNAFAPPPRSMPTKNGSVRRNSSPVEENSKGLDGDDSPSLRGVDAAVRGGREITSPMRPFSAGLFGRKKGRMMMMRWNGGNQIIILVP